jgi:hypothetical protein
MRKKFLSENLKGRDYLEDLLLDGKIIIEWFLGKEGWEGMDWMYLALDRKQWLALGNVVMNLQVLKKVGNS